MTDELEVLKRMLRSAMPKRIGEAVARYDDFALTDPGETARDFAAHHAACKAALTHIDLLVKLLRWAADEVRDEAQEELGETELLAQARAALSRETCDDEDEP